MRGSGKWDHDGAHSTALLVTNQLFCRLYVRCRFSVSDSSCNVCEVRVTISLIMATPEDLVPRGLPRVPMGTDTSTARSVPLQPVALLPCLQTRVVIRNSNGDVECACASNYTGVIGVIMPLSPGWFVISKQLPSQCFFWRRCVVVTKDTVALFKFQEMRGPALCSDVDECAANTDGCAHNCHNAIGTFSCSCYAGYALAGNGKSCNEISCGSNQYVYNNTCTSCPANSTNASGDGAASGNTRCDCSGDRYWDSSSRTCKAKTTCNAGYYRTSQGSGGLPTRPVAPVARISTNLTMEIRVGSGTCLSCFTSCATGKPFLVTAGPRVRLKTLCNTCSGALTTMTMTTILPA